MTVEHEVFRVYFRVKYEREIVPAENKEEATTTLMQNMSEEAFKYVLNSPTGNKGLYSLYRSEFS